METRSWNIRFIKRKIKPFGRKLHREQNNYRVELITEFSKPRFFNLGDNNSNSSIKEALIAAAILAKVLRGVFRTHYDGNVLQNS